MKNLLSDIKYKFSGYDFFNKKYLCRLDIASSRFADALNDAREYYEKKNVTKIRPELIHDTWKANIATLESYFTNKMNENFMSDDIINGTMVFTNRKAHKIEIKNIADVIDARTVGKIISNNLNSAFIKGKSKKGTIINSVHHLHHLMQFEQATKRKIGSMSSIVEFGGGYGNLARIANNVGFHNDYHIIDLLLLSCIQYVFLCTAFGKERISFDRNESMGDTKIVLHRLSDFDIMKNLHGELFISTWALSESPRMVYEWIANRDWFGAKGLLLAYNNLWKPWQEGEVKSTLENNGWCVEHKAIPFLPGNFYLFATR